MRGPVPNERHGGYVTDIAYRRQVCAEMDPQHLAYVCAVLGKETALACLSHGIDYCDLGCGTGDSTLAMANAHPASRFVGIDFNPAHVARARAIARRAGLTNVQFVEMSFEECLRRWNFPAFDVIAANGVYSWVGGEQRRQILDLLSQALRADGLVYLSYNVLPGWSHILPLRHLAVASISERELTTPERMRTASHAISQLARACELDGLRIPELTEFDKLLRNESPSYIAHEFFNSEWHPAFSHEVADDMGRAGLFFIGQATVARNYSENLPPGLREFLGEHPRLKQLVLDIATGARFRRDLFVSEHHDLSAALLLQQGNFAFVAMDGTTAFPDCNAVSLGDQCLAIARERPLALDDVLTLAHRVGVTAKSAMETIQRLVAKGELLLGRGVPFGQTSDRQREALSLNRLNQAWLEEADADQILFVQSPVLVRPVQLHGGQAVQLKSYLPGDSPSIELKSELKRNLMRLRILE